MAVDRKPRVSLGDTAPAPALVAATEEKDYFSARVPKSTIARFKAQQIAEGEKHGWRFFIKMVDFYLEHHGQK